MSTIDQVDLPLSRNDTPEPNIKQGRRNDSETGVQLLDADGDLSAKLEACLGHIFAKYLDPSFKAQKSESGLMVSLFSLISWRIYLIYLSLQVPDPGAYMTGEGGLESGYILQATLNVVSLE